MRKRAKTSPAEDGAVKPFLEHLEDLRTALIRSLVALCAGIMLAVPIAPHILRWLKHPLEVAGKDPRTFVQNLEMVGGISMAMKVVIGSGLLIASPFIVLFIAGFVSPGLTERERTGIRRYAGVAVLLFALGVSIAYFFVLPFAIQIMFRISDWMSVTMNTVLLTSYVSFCLQLLLAFGITFELPMVLVFLGYIGVISASQLRVARPYIIVGIFILAAILTPPDPFSQSIMAIPLVIFFEVSILIIAAAEKRRGKEDEEEEPDHAKE